MARSECPHQDPEGLPGGTAAASAGLFEGFVRDAAVNGSVFLSLPEDPWAEFRATLAQARASLDRVRAERVHSPEEREILHRDALSGALGDDMRTLARHIEAGNPTWGEAFEGDSEYSALLVPHVSRMLEEHQESVRLALEEDPTFDPFADDLGR